jgi:hypothetical protein
MMIRLALSIVSVAVSFWLGSFTWWQILSVLLIVGTVAWSIEQNSIEPLRERIDALNLVNKQ